MMEGLGTPRVGGLASSTVEGLGLSSRVEGLGLSTMEGLAPKMRGWPEQPYYYPYYKDPAQGISVLLTSSISSAKHTVTMQPFIALGPLVCE